MEHKLAVNQTYEKSEKVTEANTAKAYGSGSIEVYATPAMIGLMEGASLALADQALPEGYSTVGTKVDVSHIAATPLGMTVTAKATLTEISGKKLVFSVEASDERGKIGSGTHTRAIVETEKFLKTTNEK